MINFQTDAQRCTYERVSQMLAKLYGESVRPSPTDPVFWLRYGSAVCGVSVEPFVGAGSYVRAFSWTVTGANASDELCRFLVEANARMRLGAFAVDTQGDVEFAYGLLGETLTKEELGIAVQAVMTTSDDLDDVIVARFGGVRACDRTPVAPPADFDRALDEAGLRLPPSDAETQV